MSQRASTIALGSGVIAVAALALISVTSVRSALPERSSSSAIRAASAERAAAAKEDSASTDVSYDVAYSPKMERDRVAWVEPSTKATTVDITVVNATPDADLDATARACADTVPAGKKVQCYVFASTEAYDYKNISATLPDTGEAYAIVNLCWAVLARRDAGKAGGKPPKVELNDMRPAPATWESQGCPESWTGGAA